VSDPVLIHIARAGVVIGKYKSSEVLSLFSSSELKPTDHYWQEGMAGWGLLPEYIENARAAVPLAQEKPATPSWMLPPKHKASQYGEEPASIKQRDLIASFGIILPHYITKFDASRWIDLLMANDEALEVKRELEVKALMERQDKLWADGYWANGYRTLSGYLRAEKDSIMEAGEQFVSDAKAEVSELRNEGKLTEAKEKKLMTKALKEQEAHFDEARVHQHRRVGYWRWIIRLSRCSGARYDELIEDGTSEGYADGKENEEGFGPTEWGLLGRLIEEARAFKGEPGLELIWNTLNKLDLESKTWDDSDPGLLLRRISQK
jgi:hypothetical protein